MCKKSSNVPSPFWTAFAESISFAPALATESVNSETTALKYIASYPDLIAAFVTDTDKAISHYTIHGKGEGRIINGFTWGKSIGYNFHSGTSHFFYSSHGTLFQVIVFILCVS